MTSNEKVVNMKVVRLIETNNFAFWIILIRGHMRSLEPKQETEPKLHNTSTSRVLKFRAKTETS
jgi:hypothetical protein